MELHPHQREAVEKIKNGSVLNGGVGSGKTHAAVAYFVEKVCGGSLKREFPMAKPKQLIVITTAKKRDDRDWQSTALECGIFEDPELSYGRKGLIVDSWNNIKKYLDTKDAFFIFDEQKAAGAGVWVKTFLKIVKQNEWILLSATPADTWIDYVPLFIAHGFYRNRTDFIENHVVWTFHGKFRKIRGFYGVKKLQKYRDQILVEMPFERHTTRHLVAVPADYDKETFEKVWKNLWNVYTNEPLIDVAEKHRIGRKVVNSDPSRGEAIRKLLEKHPRIIVFYNFDYELEILRELWKDANQHVLMETDPNAGPSKSYPSIFPSKSGFDSSLRTDSSTPSATRSPVQLSTGSTKTGLRASRSTEATSVESGLSDGSLGARSQDQRESGTSERRSGESTPGYETESNTSHIQTDGPMSRTSRLKKSTATTPLEIAEWNGHRHDPVPTSDRWLYLVQYQAGSEGWNCTTTDAIVFHSLSYSHKQFEQAQGRIDRLDTPFTDLWYYILISDSKIDQLIWKALVAKKNFHEGRNIKFAA